MSSNEEVQLAEPEKKSAPLKWIVIGVVAALVLTGGVLGALFAMGMLGSEPAAAAADAKDGATEVPKAAIYVPLTPPFTVNFSGDSRARFLQIGVDLMTRDPAVEDTVKQHMPVIRNNLVMLFSSKTSAELSTPEGKKQLQGEALKTVQKVLERETGSKGVEAAYFTSFVMQ